MKATIFVSKEINIPDSKLPELAKKAAAARRRRKGSRKVSEWPLEIHELIEQALRAGMFKAGEYSLNCDDDRYWYEGAVRASSEIPWEKILK